MAEHHSALPPILPPGTQVVSRVPVRPEGRAAPEPAGAVGVIVRAPADADHAYRVRFVDGGEASLHRRELAVLKHEQRERGGLTAGTLADHDLHEHVIFRCVVGSRAFGLDEDGSDVDRRGIYLPPADMHWSLYGVPDQLENDATQECYWELQKFLTLALKANPNVLECLYSPLVEHAAPIAERLLTIREAFLSKLIYQTYNGYVLSQFKKLTARLDADREIKWKHAMHLIRLLLAGITALREGTIPVAVGEHRERLLAIRRGQLAWDEVDAWRLELHRDFDEAYASTRLPDRPDYQRANAFLVEARNSMTRGERRISATATAPSPTSAALKLPEFCARKLSSAIARHPHPLLFATISGAHLYGFPSADSDFDLRGVHVLPQANVLSLWPTDETVTMERIDDGLEIDLVTHDAAKFFRLMLRPNGYVLEQLLSPLVVHTTPEHEELKALAPGVITRHHAHHYLGFARTQWGLFAKERRIKPLLYTYRVLLTGIHLMRTGEVEANLPRLNESARLPHVTDLIARKTGGREDDLLGDADSAFHEAEYHRLTIDLNQAHGESTLPHEPSAGQALSELLVRVRLR